MLKAAPIAMKMNPANPIIGWMKVNNDVNNIPVETGNELYDITVKPSKYFPLPPSTFIITTTMQAENMEKTIPTKKIATPTPNDNSIGKLFKDNTRKLDPINSQVVIRTQAVFGRSLSFFAFLIASRGDFSKCFKVFIHIIDHNTNIYE